MLSTKEIQCKVAPILSEDPYLITAYLFGSFAQGTARPTSDVDIAVLYDPSKVSDDLFDDRNRLIERIQSALQKTTEVIVLNQTQSIFFKFVIIREGKVIYECDHGQRVDFELSVMQQYYDFQPFLEQYNKAYIERNLQ